MTAHPMIVETGPIAVRRLCCGATGYAGAELAGVALDYLDDPVAVVDDRPVTVGALWQTVLRSLACRQPVGSVMLIHPSWWSTARVELVAAAATALADEVAGVVTRTRAEVLGAAEDSVVVEIAARLVAITAAGTVAEPRVGSSQQVSAAVARRVGALTGGANVTVRIDAPEGVDGADALAALIAAELREVLVGTQVEFVDVAALAQTGMPATARQARVRRRIAGRIPVLVAGLALLGVAALGAGVRGQPGAPASQDVPPTFLVEGRVALQVPAQWPVQRITSGPGSARVQVVSPSDPQVMLHVTQSPAPGETLSGAADTLRRAIAREPGGVFVDFDPAGTVAGRPAVTYREIRPGHDIDWTVLVEDTVRISIGCQHPSAEGAVRAVCDQAVRSARTLHRGAR